MSTPFSPSYAAARARFSEAAALRGYALESLPLGGVAPDGTSLTLDVACGGPATPSTMVVSSGLHGVEAPLGSAVMLDWISRLGVPPLRVVLLHGLNPFGHAWGRRADGDGIDLNRNLLLPGERHVGHPPLYEAVDTLLNPATRRRGWAECGAAVERLLATDAATLRGAIASGQHDFARGLFFGGHGPSGLSRILSAHLPRWLEGCDDVIHVDLHSGLGPWARTTVLVEHDGGSPELKECARWLSGIVVEAAMGQGGVGYEVRGELGAFCRARAGAQRYDALTVEVGTYPPAIVLAALAWENRAWHVSRQRGLALARRLLAEVFCPSSRRWRAHARRGCAAVLAGVTARALARARGEHRARLSGAAL